MKKKAIFLDRDGTINQDSGYTHKIEQWRWMPDALAGLREFNRAGWPMIIVSNQSGIGRGYYNREQLAQLENEVKKLLQAEHISMLAWKYCPHLPGANCSCRKPAPGMLLESAKEFNLNLAQSWMLGDKISDIEAGLAAGCQAGLIGNPGQDERQKLLGAYPGLRIWDNLLQAAIAINSLN